jgi:ATP-dependent RNA helicase RhlE
MPFKELGLSAPLVQAVAAEGYTTPTPIQAQAIPHLLAGRDLLGCAQTGTGKTAAFALPVLERLMRSQNPAPTSNGRVRCLILSPTRELALQICESIGTYGRHARLRHAAVFGGVGQGPQTRSLQRGVDLLVATPGRLVDLMQQGYVDLSGVEIFVLDEADRMLDMGFLPDLRRVLARLPEKRQTILFSATMPEPIMAMAESILHDPVDVRIALTKAAAPRIDQSVCFVSQRHKSRLLACHLSSGKIDRALVFTRTKRGADRVVRDLSAAGIRSAAIHGNKSQSVRQRTLDDFRSHRTRILVATDIAARGIDVDGISHVVNYDLPFEPETYVHRIGRTGRAGASGIAISFCDEQEQKLLKAIERLTRKSLAVQQPPNSDALPKMQENVAHVPAHRPSAPRSGSPGGQKPRTSHGRGYASRGKRRADRRKKQRELISN